MKILFTGGSSFTGYWFVRQLALAGHEVVAVFRRPADEYEALRSTRVRNMADSCRGEYGCAFGDDRFLDLVRGEESWDVFCHHAADVTNYRSQDFDVLGAVSNNTRSLTTVLDVLRDKGCGKIVLTGSFFENGEGAGSGELRAFSPYGLSKAITAQMFRYYALDRGFRVGKFVIPNPFGPYEEPRFTSYLVRSWYEGKIPAVNTPEYVRDNIHVSLLAKAYVHFLQQLGDGRGFEQLNPSGYPASQGMFARYFGDQLSPRLGLDCQVALNRQTEFSESYVRINTDSLDRSALGWNEDEAWDELAEYYRQAFGDR